VSVSPSYRKRKAGDSEELTSACSWLESSLPQAKFLCNIRTRTHNRKGWDYGYPSGEIHTAKGELYIPYIHVFLEPPKGNWWASKWKLLPVYFWKDDITEIGFQYEEPVPVLVVKKVNYPDPEKYFSLLEGYQSDE